MDSSCPALPRGLLGLSAASFTARSTAASNDGALDLPAFMQLENRTGTRTFAAEDWNIHRLEISELYEDHTLEHVRGFMREQHGLDATAKQYKDRIKKWGLDKKVKTDEMEAIIRKQRQRASKQNKASAFRVRKRPVKQEKIDRFIHEHPESIDLASAAEIDMSLDSATTPTCISVYTPSNTGPLTPPVSWSPTEDLDTALLTNVPTTSALTQAVHITAAPIQERYRQVEENQLRGDLSIVEVMLGKSHWEYLDKARLIATVLCDQGKYKTAEDMLLTSISNYQKSNKDDFHILAASALLGQIICAQGFYDRAEELQIKTVQDAHDLLGPDNPVTLASLGTLASTYHYQGRLKEAETLGAQLVERSSTILGQGHHFTMTFMDNLAETLQAQERFKEAEDLIVQVLARKICVLGQENRRTLISTHALGGIYCEVNRFKEAEDLIVRAMKLRMQVLGQEHPETLTSLNDLAWLYVQTTRFEEAEDVMLQVIETRTKVLGREHPDTRMSLEVLSFIWEKCEKFGNVFGFPAPSLLLHGK